MIGPGGHWGQKKVWHAHTIFPTLLGKSKKVKNGEKHPVNFASVAYLQIKNTHVLIVRIRGSNQKTSTFNDQHWSKACVLSDGLGGIHLPFPVISWISWGTKLGGTWSAMWNLYFYENCFNVIFSRWRHQNRQFSNDSQDSHLNFNRNCILLCVRFQWFGIQPRKWTLFKPNWLDIIAICSDDLTGNHQW